MAAYTENYAITTTKIKMFGVFFYSRPYVLNFKQIMPSDPYINYVKLVLLLPLYK